jgi:hypothetical protein
MLVRLRIGIFIQAGLSSSYRILLFLKPLRSIRITGLLRYFGLLRHPLGFRPSTEWLSHPRAGFPGSSADLSTRAVPFHPGCLVIALARCFITSGRLPLSRQVGRQRIPLEAATLRVRFRYSSRFCFPRLQPTDFAVSCSGRYMSNEQFTWWVPFIPLDQPGLSWRTDRQGALVGSRVFSRVSMFGCFANSGNVATNGDAARREAYATVGG